MDSPYSPLEFSLLNNWQRDFPLVSRPFDEIGRQVGAGGTAMAGSQRMSESTPTDDASSRHLRLTR